MRLLNQLLLCRLDDLKLSVLVDLFLKSQSLHHCNIVSKLLLMTMLHLPHIEMRACNAMHRLAVITPASVRILLELVQKSTMGLDSRCVLVLETGGLENCLTAS